MNSTAQIDDLITHRELGLRYALCHPQAYFTTCETQTCILSNYIPYYLWDAIIHPYPISINALAKSPLKLEHGPLITWYRYIGPSLLAKWDPGSMLRILHCYIIKILYSISFIAGIPIINIRRSDGRLRFIMGITALIRRCPFSE